MNVGILTFPGSNCDHDVYHVVKHVSGSDAKYVWRDVMDAALVRTIHDVAMDPELALMVARSER